MKGAARRDDRNAEILRLRESGATLQEIADKYGLSRERIRQIVDATLRRRRESRRGDAWRGEANEPAEAFGGRPDD